MLDHKLLNKVEALGPPTLENLSRFIWERVQPAGQSAGQRSPRQLQRELQLFRPQDKKVPYGHSKSSSRIARRAPGTGSKALRDDICAAFERLEDEAPAALSRRVRPLRTHAVGAHRSHRQARRRRRDVGDAWPAVRKGRRALFDGPWRIRTGIPRPDPRRRRRSRILGLRHFADRASAQSEHSGCAHEHPLRRHHQSVVRRRRGSDAAPRAAADAAGCRAVASTPRCRPPATLMPRSRSTRNTKNGPTTISVFLTVRGPAASAAFSQMTITTAAMGTRISPSPKGSARAFLDMIDGGGVKRRWEDKKNGAKPNVIPRRKWIGAAAMSNSTCSTTAAPGSALRPAAMSKSIWSSMPPVAEWP